MPSSKTNLYSSIEYKKLRDSRAILLGTIIKKLYPSIVKKFRKYIDAEELKVLKSKTDDIRQLKRY